MATRRGVDGRYATAWSDRELLRIIGAVARVARPAAPERLSARAFNDGRALVEDRWTGVPSASAIIQRLNDGGQAHVSWTRMVEAGLGRDVQQRQTIVTGTRSYAGPLDDRAVFTALRTVAAATDERLTPDEYTRVRERLIASRSGRRRDAILGLLPTANQLIFQADGWDNCLRAAELNTGDNAHEAIFSDAPRSSRPTRPRGMPPADAICWFVRLQGARPSEEDLGWFAKREGIALARTRPFGVQFRAATELLEAEGLAMPDSRVPVAERRRDTGDRLPPEVRALYPQVGYSRADCVDAMLAHWNALEGRSEPTQQSYRTWATGRPRPSAATIGTLSTFTDIKDAARRLRLQSAHSDLSDVNG